MYHPRWLIRIVVALAIASFGDRAQALVVAGGPTANTTSSGFNSVFYNVGYIGNGAAVYLGDGWMLTASHVNVPLESGISAGFNIPGLGSQYYQVVNSVRITSQSGSYPGTPDLQLVQLAQAPPLPSIFQTIPTSSPQTGTVATLVGGGRANGGPLYWNNATSSSSTINLGNSSTTAFVGTPNPIISDTVWTNGTMPSGTYQDAGFAWNGGSGIQWGESVISFVKNPAASQDIYNSNTFLTTFYNSTYDPPANSAWAPSVAAIGSNMAAVASGDSGGAAFVNTASGWRLAGMLAYVDQYSRSQSGSPYPSTAYGDLSFSVDLSTYRNSILSVINSTATWTGQAGNTWDTTSASWADAGHKAATTFTSTASTGNAIFGNSNPLLGIPLNSSLQSIVVQPGGVSAASITFTNTGSANGGTDYLIGGGSISGSPLLSGVSGIPSNNSIVLSGNGNGTGGAVFLSGANSFTGGVLVGVGRLNLQNSLALGNSSGVTVDAGAALELQNSGSAATFGQTATGSVGIGLTLNGSGIGGTGALDNLSGNNTYAGPITLGSPVTIDSSSASGQLSLTGGIATAGNALTFIGSGNTSISGSGGITGGGTLTKAGSGTLTLNFAGAGSPASNLLATNTALAVGGGTLQVNGANSGSTNQTVASLSINSGSSAIVDTSNGVSSNFIVTSGTIGRAVGGTVDFTLPAAGSISFTTPPTQTGGILSGWATVGGASWATLGGNALAAYGGATLVSSGSQAISGGTNYDITGSFAASGAANSLRFVNGVTPAIVTLTGALPITTGGILVPASVSSATTITGGTLQGAGGADLVVIQNSASPLTISSAIADNGSPTGLTKSGSGALTLTSSNGYTGPTTLNAGTLNINNSAALGVGSFVINGGTIDNTSGNNSIITTNAETWNGSFAYQGTNSLGQSTGAVTLSTSPTITISNGGTLSIGGAIGGNFGLTLAGSGTLSLNGANTFTGGVTINGGMFRIGNSAALNSSTPNTVTFGPTSAGTLNLNGNSVSVGGLSSTSANAIVEASAPLTAASAMLTINGIGNYAFAGSITNGGLGPLSLAKSGSGTQILSGLNTYTGGTTINGGVLQFNADADLPPGLANTTVNSGGTIAAGSAIDQPFLTAAHITSNSSGTIALAANSGNALNFGGLSASLGSTGNYVYSGALTPNGSTYILGGGGGLLTFSGMLGGANSLTVQNGGNVALTASNSYTGGTTINSGTSLLISADGSAGANAELGLVPSSASANITINGGTLVATSSFTLNPNRGIVLGATGGAIDVDGIVNLNTLIYGGVVSGTSGGSLTLTDTGTLVLSGPNSYNGATNINSGTLRAGAVNTLPQMSAVALGLGGTLQLNGFSQSIGSLTGGGIVTNNSSTSVTLTVGNDGTSPAAFYGVLSDTTASNTGTLALTKVGDGILALSGLNTYSGGTTVSDGTLATVGGGTLGSGSLRISATDGVFSNVSIGATQSVSSLTNSATANGLALLSVASGTTLTSTGPLTNTGTLNIGASGYAGMLIIDGALTFNANSKLQLTTGTLEFNVTSGAATVQSGVTATVAAGATLQLAGTVSDLSNGSSVVNITNNGSTASGGGLLVTGTKQTVGTVAGNATTSSGATTYAGDTVVAAGASLTATQILQNTLTIGAGAR